MTHDINSALERLEKNLKDIDSARIQVEKTVSSSNQLQKIANEYISSVKSFYIEVQNWEKESQRVQALKSSEVNKSFTKLEDSCKKIISSFYSNFDNFATTFKEKTNETIEKFASQNQILTDRTKELEKFREALNNNISEVLNIKNSLAKTSKELQESQQRQDNVLDDIRKRIISTSSDLKSESKNIIEKTHQDKEDTTSKITEVSYSIHGIEDVLNNKFTKLSEHLEILAKKNDIDLLDSAIHECERKFKLSIESLQSKVEKSLKMNRLIIIAGIVILAILQYIIK